MRNGLGLTASLLLACTSAPIRFADDGANTDAGGLGDLTPAQLAAASAFNDNVKPLLKNNCTVCHASMPGVEFMAGDDIRASMLAWPHLIEISSPRDSRILSKGAHEGPALTVEQHATISEWIDLEVLASDASSDNQEEVLETPAFVPAEGANVIDLTAVGRAGSSLEFTLQTIANGWYVSNLLVRGGPGGAHLVHPLFVTWADETPQVDAIDRFSEVEVDVAEGATAPLGGGLVVLLGIPASAKMSVHFLKVEPAKGNGGGDGGDGGLGGGCKSVAQFTAAAQPLLAANCASCHAGNNDQATSATDMSKINDLSPEGQAAACGQILSRVNLTSPMDSGLFIAPDPNSGVAHQFKFPNQGAFTGFRSSLLVWVNQEINQ